MILKRRHPTARDPVCGMNVDERRAAATAEYDGTTYYFCSNGCREEFESRPESFVST